MKLIYLTIVLALAISATQGAPERKIVVPVKRNPNYIPNTQNQIQNIHKRAPNLGEIPLIDFNKDSAYLGIVHVGTPPKPFNIYFDTGSSDFWIGTTSCSECLGQHLYDRHDSSTFSRDNRPWSTIYDDKSEASGIMFSDTIDMGGIQIKNLSIYAALELSGNDNNPAIDGLMGLGFGSGATIPGVKTPFEVMVENKLISSPIFSVYLGKSTYKIVQDDGEFVFGGYNSAHIGGDLTTIPVDSSHSYWGITVNNIKANDTSFLDQPYKAIVDTGTSAIQFPQELALEIAKYYKTREYNGIFTIDCNEDDLPPLVFDIGGTEFSVPGDALIHVKTRDYCLAGFGISDSDNIILGDTFMKNYYFIFNIAVPQIQIAPLK